MYKIGDILLYGYSTEEIVFIIIDISGLMVTLKSISSSFIITLDYELMSSYMVIHPIFNLPAFKYIFIFDK